MSSVLMFRCTSIPAVNIWRWRFKADCYKQSSLVFCNALLLYDC